MKIDGVREKNELKRGRKRVYDDAENRDGEQIEIEMLNEKIGKYK